MFNILTNCIYINPDLTPAAAKLAFEKRQRRRDKAALSRNQVSNNNCPNGEAESLVQADAATAGTNTADPGSHAPTATNVDIDIETVTPVSYTHLTLPTTPYV